MGERKEAVRISDGNAIAHSVVSRDGRYVVIAAEDGFTQFTFWRPDDLFREACARLIRNLTEEEWKYYIGGHYSKTCPSLP